MEALAATKPESEPEGNAGVRLDLAGRMTRRMKGGALVAPRAPSLGGARPPARHGGSHVLALPLALLVAACPSDASAMTVLRLGTVGVDWALSNRNGSIRAAARVPGCAHTAGAPSATDGVGVVLFSACRRSVKLELILTVM